MSSILIAVFRPSTTHVQLPTEHVEGWRALPNGSFERELFDMAAFLHDAELDHLCEILLIPFQSEFLALTKLACSGDLLDGEHLGVLNQREREQGREAFMSHLLSLGVERLADRQASLHLSWILISLQRVNPTCTPSLSCW